MTFVQDGDDEFFACDGHEEDAAEDCEGFVEELEVGAFGGARVFELVAQGWAEEVVGEVCEGEIGRVGYVALWGGQLFGEVFAELHYGWFVVLVLVGFVILVLVVLESTVLLGYGEGAWIAHSGRGGRLGADGPVEFLEAAERCRQVAAVESVGVHLHEQRKRMQREEDLRRPRPVSRKRPGNPNVQPQRLHQTLHEHAAFLPPQPSLAVLIHAMQRQVQPRARAHQHIAHAQLPDILREQRPLLEIQQIPRLFQIPQHTRDHHDRQPDPEEHKKAAEVAVVAPRIEIREAGGVFYGGEEAGLRFAPELATRGGGCFDGGRSIVGRSGRATRSALFGNGDGGA